MRLTRFRITMVVVLVAFVGFAVAGVMLRHEPEFYRRAAVPAGSQRYETSHEFVIKDCVQFVSNFSSGKGPPWTFTFTQNQLNSFFEEDFVRFGDADYFRKLGITNPRLEIADNRIRLGFRYGAGSWSTVLSYDLKIWLVPNEVNVLAVEIERRRAGALPIPTQYVFQQLKEIGRRQNIDIEWFRHNGNPVAILKFQCDRPRPTAQLQRLEIGSGTLTVQGLTFDPAQNPLDEPIKKAPAEVQVSQGASQ